MSVDPDFMKYPISAMTRFLMRWFAPQLHAFTILLVNEAYRQTLIDKRLYWHLRDLSVQLLENRT